MTARTTWRLFVWLACTGVGCANAQETSGVKVKEITKVSSRAAVVLDKNCPTLVEPFTLSDNVASLAAYGIGEKAKDVAKNIGAFIGNTFGDKSAAPRSSVDMLDSMRKAAKQLNWLPMPAEVEFGERMHAEVADTVLDRDSRLGKRYYPAADDMLGQVTKAIGEPTDYVFKLYILKNATHNAVARPGGFIYVDQGLVDNPAMRPKAYFALAHELAHVLQRHETKELQSYAIDSVSAKDELAKAMVTARKDPNVLLSRVKLEKNQFTQHHIDQELQADSCAARLLSHALPDDRAVAASLDAFLSDLPNVAEATPVAGGNSAAERFSDSLQDIVDSPVQRHPSSAERKRNLQSMVAEIRSPPARRP